MEANAVARYKLFIKVPKLFQLIEVFIAVILITWSSSRLPSALKLSGEHLLAFLCNLLNQHVVFFVGNVIIVVCYVLSRRNDAGNDSDIEKYSLSSQEKTTEDVSIGESHPPVKEVQAVKEMTGEDDKNQRVCYENAMVKVESDMTVETAIKQAAKQIEWFSRTQSEKLKREISVRPQRELRRSATEPARGSNMLVTSFNGSSPAISIETVEKLSNEEFQRAVETFISNHQRFLKRQSMAENGVRF